MINAETLKVLKNKVKEVTTSKLPFMEGREKGEITLGKIYNIIDYGYMNNEDGEYAVFITKEEPKLFFFGASVVTDNLKTIDNALTQEQLKELLSENGIEVVFTKKKSKNKREYTVADFFPSEE